MNTAFRFVRLVYAVMLIAAIVYACLPELVHAQTREVNSAVVFALIAVSCSLVVTTIIFRNRMVLRLERVLANAPEDQAALKRWRTGNLGVFMGCEAIVLYGLVLRFLGAPFRECVIFYLVGISLLLAFRPHRPA